MATGSVITVMVTRPGKGMYTISFPEAISITLSPFVTGLPTVLSSSYRKVRYLDINSADTLTYIVTIYPDS